MNYDDQGKALLSFLDVGASTHYMHSVFLNRLPRKLGLNNKTMQLSVGKSDSRGKQKQKVNMTPVAIDWPDKMSTYTF